MTYRAALAFLLGDFEGHPFRGNQYSDGEGGGAGGTGAKFDAPAAGPGAKAWTKARQKDYDTDPEFRAAVDAISLLTQGGTTEVHAASLAASGAPLPELTGNPWKDRPIKLAHGEGLDKPISAHTSPFASYKAFFKGQDLENAEHATLREAGRAINRAIETAPPTTAPIYRGLDVDVASVHVSPDGEATRTPNPVLAQIDALKSGDTMDIHGVSSFTANRETAEQFSKGIARGQRGYAQARREGRDGRTRAVTIEIRPGAKALPVGALSPWKQQELLTRGSFRVVDVQRSSKDRTRYGDPIEDVHLVLEAK